MELKKDQLEQKKRQKIQRILSGNDYQITTYKIISTNKFQYTIMSCVIVNILLLILPQMPSTTPFAKWFERNRVPLNTLDSIFLSIYITEMCLKIFACRKEVRSLFPFTKSSFNKLVLSQQMGPTRLCHCCLLVTRPRLQRVRIRQGCRQFRRSNESGPTV